MPLLISMIKSPVGVNNEGATKTFNAQGGYIGRGAHNHWVLKDPERFLSAKHCQIVSQSGQYFIIDLSTNGTFINGSVEALGKNNRLELKEGDVFGLGEYEFQITQCIIDNNGATPYPFDQTSASATYNAGPFAEPGMDGDIFNTPLASQGSGFDPFSKGYVSASEPLFTLGQGESDPLAALDKAGQGFSSAPNQYTDLFSSGASHSDGASSINQAVSWPAVAPENTSGAIPADWDDDDLNVTPPAPLKAKPVPPALQQPPVLKPRQQAAPIASHPVMASAVVDGMLQEAQRKINELEQVNKKLALELGALMKQKTRPGVVAGAVSPADSVLIKALGLGDRELSDDKVLEISQITGELTREMIAGLMKVLSSRSSIKNEFRMSVTTIQPVENNPLKFSVNVDDALENMFFKKGNAYKAPKKSVAEGFLGIAEHQIAVLSGMRAAFKGILERFDPATLEKRFDKQNKGGLIPGSKNAKNWDLFCDYYKDLVGDLDRSFQHIFGDDFVREYEDQLQRLAALRSKQKIDK